MMLKDRVAIVVYAGSSGLVLQPTPGDHRGHIHRAIAELEQGNVVVPEAAGNVLRLRVRPAPTVETSAHGCARHRVEDRRPGEPHVAADDRGRLAGLGDRRGIVRLVYQGRATPLATHVTPGNKLWIDAARPATPNTLACATG